MRRTRGLSVGATVAGMAIFLMVWTVGLGAQQGAGAFVTIDNDDLGGVVTSSKGWEAGVWVIAETTDLETKFVRIVVTDDEGRYLMPDLPEANYRVWVRGYGLIDSPQTESQPGRILNLKAVLAPDAAAAAGYYPALYWFSLLTVPEKSELAQRRQGRRLRHVPPTGQQGDSHRSQAVHGSRLLGGRLAAAHRVGTGHEVHGEKHRQDGPSSGSVAFCGLDRSNRRRRASGLSTIAAPGCGAKRRDHPVGLGRTLRVPS